MQIDHVQTYVIAIDTSVIQSGRQGLLLCNLDATYTTAEIINKIFNKVGFFKERNIEKFKKIYEMLNFLTNKKKLVKILCLVLPFYVITIKTFSI